MGNGVVDGGLAGGYGGDDVADLVVAFNLQAVGCAVFE